MIISDCYYSCFEWSYLSFQTIQFTFKKRYDSVTRNVISNVSIARMESVVTKCEVCR